MSKQQRPHQASSPSFAADQENEKNNTKGENNRSLNCRNLKMTILIHQKTTNNKGISSHRHNWVTLAISTVF